MRSLKESHLSNQVGFLFVFIDTCCCWAQEELSNYRKHISLLRSVLPGHQGKSIYPALMPQFIQNRGIINIKINFTPAQQITATAEFVIRGPDWWIAVFPGICLQQRVYDLPHIGGIYHRNSSCEIQPAPVSVLQSSAL